MLGPDGEPLARKYYAEKTERDLDADEVIRGYEIKPGKYIPISDEELDRLAPEKTRDIDIKLFVPAEIDSSGSFRSRLLSGSCVEFRKSLQAARRDSGEGR